MATQAKILIIRLSSIGDIIQCSAVPRCLKRAWPESEIHWLVRSDNEELVKFNPYIDRTISFHRKEKLEGWIELSKSLKSENYTHIYDAHNNLRSLIMTFFLKSPHFIRRSKNRLKRFLLFAFKLNFFPKPYLPAESYVLPLKRWGVPYDGEGGELKLPPETIEKIKRLIPEGRAKWMALAPATAWPKKSWPLASWKILIAKLLKDTTYHFLILGGPQDSFCQELVLDSSRVLSLQGKISLLESATATTLCNTLIAADTGLLHLAEALKVNVVALIGPTPFGYPSRKESTVLETKLWCKPCSKDGSGLCINPTYQKCMKVITPHQVAQAAQKIMGEV